MFDPLEVILGIVTFFVGLCFGSFANVVIYRLPNAESVIRPRSRCGKCKQMIAWYDNIPVVSWLLLRGECRRCHVKISPRYPFVEFLMGLMWLAVYIKFVVINGTPWTAVEYMILTFGLVTISFIDLDHRIIPDEFSLGGIVVGLCGAFLNPEREFLDAVLGFVLGGGFLWMVAYLYLVIRKEDGLGGGDIKLMAWLGACLGWMSVPFIILVSSLLGSVFGLVLIARGGNLKSSLPFGPFIVAAAYVYLFAGEELARWYISLFLDLPLGK